MRVTIKQLRQAIKEAMETAVQRLTPFEAQEYFPKALEDLSKTMDDPDAIFRDSKFYFKGGTLFLRSWDATEPMLKWSNRHWSKASLNRTTGEWE